MNRIQAYYYKLLLLLFVGIFSTLYSFAQRSIDKADRLFDLNKYAEAIPLYEKALSGLSTDEKDKATEKLADCYRLTGNFEKAEDIYKTLIKNKKKSSSSLFNYGQALKASAKYAEAKKAFLDYVKFWPQDSSGHIYVESCDSAQYWLDHPSDYEVRDVPFVNTEKAEFSPVPYMGGLLITTNRNYGVKPFVSFEGDQKDPLLDMYYKKINASQVNDSSAIKLFPELNSSLHEGTPTFTADGKQIYFVRTIKGVRIKEVQKKEFTKKKSSKKSNEPNAADEVIIHTLQIYSSELKGNLWTSPVSALPCNSNVYSVFHPSISADGKKLFFASDMSGGFGGTDIYVCFKSKDGWSNPYNLGPDVNTSEMEMYPFIHPDGLTLYFSSNGHPGMGKLDIFKSTFDENMGWTNVQNLKPPINSIGDDFGIWIDENKETGYFSSNRINGKGDDDVYAFNQIKPIPIEFNGYELKIKNNSLFDGIIVKVKDASGESKELSTYNGYFTLYPAANTNYTLSYRKEGMLYNKLSFSYEMDAQKFTVKIKSDLRPILFNGSINKMIGKYRAPSEDTFLMDSIERKPSLIEKITKGKQIANTISMKEIITDYETSLLPDSNKLQLEAYNGKLEIQLFNDDELIKNIETEGEGQYKTKLNEANNYKIILNPLEPFSHKTETKNTSIAQQLINTINTNLPNDVKFNLDGKEVPLEKIAANTDKNMLLLEFMKTKDIPIQNIFNEKNKEALNEYLNTKNISLEKLLFNEDGISTTQNGATITLEEVAWTPKKKKIDMQYVVSDSIAKTMPLSSSPQTVMKHILEKKSGDNIEYVLNGKKVSLDELLTNKPDEELKLFLDDAHLTFAQLFLDENKKYLELYLWQSENSLEHLLFDANKDSLKVFKDGEQITLEEVLWAPKKKKTTSIQDSVVAARPTENLTEQKLQQALASKPGEDIKFYLHDKEIDLNDLVKDPSKNPYLTEFMKTRNIPIAQLFAETNKTIIQKYVKDKNITLEQFLLNQNTGDLKVTENGATITLEEVVWTPKKKQAPKTEMQYIVSDSVAKTLPLTSSPQTAMKHILEKNAGADLEFVLNGKKVSLDELLTNKPDEELKQFLDETHLTFEQLFLEDNKKYLDLYLWQSGSSIEELFFDKKKDDLKVYKDGTQITLEEVLWTPKKKTAPKIELLSNTTSNLQELILGYDPERLKINYKGKEISFDDLLKMQSIEIPFHLKFAGISLEDLFYSGNDEKIQLYLWDNDISLSQMLFEATSSELNFIVDGKNISIEELIFNEAHDPLKKYVSDNKLKLEDVFYKNSPIADKLSISNITKKAKGIVIANNVPVENAKIKLINNNTVSKETLTNANGEFEVNVNPDQTYTINTEKYPFYENHTPFVSGKGNREIPLIKIELQEKKIIHATGIITNNNQPLADAKINLYHDHKIVDQTTTNSDGQYEINVRGDDNFSISVSKEGMFNKEQEISTKGKNESVMPMMYDMTMEKINTEKEIKLVIHYEFGKANITPEAALELDKLANFLKQNPDIKLIELSSHTDALGDEEYNLALSQKRADNAANYLIYKGISRSTVKAVGYGKSKLLIANAVTEEQNQMNRRTEFKILKIAEIEPIEN